MNVFVSYTTRNNEVNKKELIEFSKKLNNFENVFIDLLHNNSDDKQKRIISELKKSDVLFLIKSFSSFNSEWVKLELKIAKNLNIPIVEFLIEDLNNLNEKDISEAVNRSTNPRNPF